MTSKVAVKDQKPLHDLECSQVSTSAQVVPIDRALNLELSECEYDLLREVILAVRGIQYGSVVLTMHDGRFVELTKTIRLRKPRSQDASH